VSRATRARKIVTAAAYGGGSLGALGAMAYGVLRGETTLARRRIPQAEEDPPRADGVWRASGVRKNRPEIVMAMLGDSGAAGYGVHTDLETPAVRIALTLSSLSRRPIRLINAAVVGAESSDLIAQVEQVLPEKPQLAVIMIGGNDVTHRIRPSDSIRHLTAALDRLHEHGVEFVVGTCPDLGTVRPLPQPLRAVARRRSRNLATAQAIAVVGAGGRAVSLGNLLGPEFEVHHKHMFSDDKFHPSALGYARAADVLIPSAADALGLTTVSRPAGPFTSTRVRPVAQAAARAASRPGTEVSGAEMAGERTGRRGPWARLIRRGATAAVTSDTPDEPAELAPASIGADEQQS